MHADETSVNVVSDDNVKSYMRVYATGADSPKDKLIDSDIKPIVLFDYHNSRASKCSVEYLNGYQGYLQVDGYAGYHHTQATLVGCWAHARRKFHEAKIAQGKKPSGKADMALSTIQKLYRIETQIKTLPISERYQIRQDKALPIINKFKDWLFSQTANGAHASAVLYSIIETAKANGLVPFDYLMQVLEQISQPDVDIDALLPWEIKLG